MALMKFRESNQVRWQGSRPGHNGTQVLENGATALLVPTSFYTVTALKTFYLTHAVLYNSINLTTNIYLDIYDTTPVFWRRLLGGRPFLNAANVSINASYWPPIEVPTGYFFYLFQAANAGIAAVIAGWEE